ncbi:hypothetical protein TNCT_603001 [Trichonephila clavata]|uniref:Uncharacterized protein n=1 Tax=Trichonephila clavata TaxID=2740835 RepID=A0A8X6HSW0_TRICU|nr:hypothetical protein TNCT_603001 [Trichonephila clavata]
MGGYVDIGNVIRFLEEAVSFYLEYHNLNWEPPTNNLEHIRYYAPFFTRSIGTAITHYCMEFAALEYEPDVYFDLVDLLQLSDSEARIYIYSYVRRYMDFLPEAAAILHFRCNHSTHYYGIAQEAVGYNLYHRQMHDESDDEGFFTSFEEEEN